MPKNKRTRKVIHQVSVSEAASGVYNTKEKKAEGVFIEEKQAEGVFINQDEYPNDWLEDFWLAVTNTDIKKDQGDDYDFDIVKGILPSNIKFTEELAKTMDILRILPHKKDGPYAATDAAYNRTTKLQDASKDDKDYLWNCLILNQDASGKPILSDTYTFFNSTVNNNEQGKIYINGTNFIYKYKVFERYSLDKKSGKYTSVGNPVAINEFMGGPFIKITDTSMGGRYMIENWPNSNLYHAHTREVEMDPASKMMPDMNNTKIDQNFWYENGKDDNPTHVEYPPYDSGASELRYFFSSRPVVFIDN
jgi:hypothetical protein